MSSSGASLNSWLTHLVDAVPKTVTKNCNVSLGLIKDTDLRVRQNFQTISFITVKKGTFCENYLGQGEEGEGQMIVWGPSDGQITKVF